MENQKSAASKRPSHRVYIVKDIPNSDRKKWIEIGAAWLHGDGKGHRIELDAVPINGEGLVTRMIDWAKIDAGETEQEPSAAGSVDGGSS